MTKVTSKDVGASVRARLQHLAREHQEDFQLLLTRYANERLLFRLASSRHAQSFVLKGATLFALWSGKPHRATRDLDLLGFGDPRDTRIHDVLKDILALEVPDDGIRFDLDSLTVGAIREAQEYAGVRAELIACVTSARVRMQIDIGFGDVITPEASLVELPSLLDFPAPKVRTYPRETVVAEKLEAMVQLGMANSRMKDFYDIAILARRFDFDGELLSRAIKATFERRRTPLPVAPAVALTSAFAADPMKKTQWTGFVRKAHIRDAGTLAETIAEVRTFVERPLLAAANVIAARALWRAGEKWE